MSSRLPEPEYDWAEKLRVTLLLPEASSSSLGLGLLHPVPLPTFISQVKHSREVFHMSWAKHLGARCGQGASVSPELGPPWRSRRRQVVSWVSRADSLTWTPFSWKNTGRKTVKKCSHPVLGRALCQGGVSGSGRGHSWTNYLQEGKKGNGTEGTGLSLRNAPCYCFPY